MRGEHIRRVPKMTRARERGETIVEVTLSKGYPSARHGVLMPQFFVLFLLYH